MITLDEELENIKNDTTKIGTKPPRIQTLSDVKNSTYGTDSEVKQLISDVESDISTILGSAVFERGAQNFKNLPEQLQIYGGQALMSLGGFVDSDKTVSMGKELIKSARGELQADEKKFWESSTPLSEKDMESFAYGLGLGIANYGAMLAIGYLNPIAGIALGSAVEIGQQAEEKIEYHIEETGDTELNKYTSQKAQKDTLYTTIYGVGSAIIEKKFGLGKQLKLVKMPITSKLRHVIETAVSEGVTEILQELYATGLDWQGGYIDSSKLPERFMDALKEGVIGAVLGGGLGVTSAVNHRSQAKAILRDSLKNTVPEKDLDNVVDGIYESANDSMSTVVAQELIQSESLRNKHGAIYESIKSEVSKQIKNTGAFADVDEMKLSQYIESTAKMFADQVLGEANKRKVVIDDVLKDSEIIYKDGRLYLQGKIEKPKVIRKPKQYNPERMELLTYIKYKGGLKDVGGELKSMDAGRQIIGLINNKNGRSLDDAMLDAWESGYFPQFSERPTVNDLLNAIDDSLRGNKIYRESFRSTIEQRQAKEKEIENEEQLNMFLSDFISEEDLDTMSLQDKQRFYDDINEQANAVSEDNYIQQEIDSLTDAEAERYAIMTENGATHDEAMQEIIGNRTPDEDIPLFFQESFDIADENARLDDIYPEYKGETININGQEKTVYNSTGERIAKSKEALQNFYKWFGDSKVVDEQGRPKVMYHGTRSKRYGKEIPSFDTFSRDKLRSYQNRVGFFFAESEAFAKEFGDRIMPVYLKMNNPKIYKKGTPTSSELVLEQQYVDRMVGDNKHYAQKILDNTKKYTDSYDKFVMDIYHTSGQIPYWSRKTGDFRDAEYETPEKGFEMADKYTQKLQSEGFDGVIIQNTEIDKWLNDGKSNNQFIVFNPNQIKSTSNRGTFNPNDNRIYYQLSAQEEENFTEMYINEGKQAILDWIDGQVKYYEDMAENADNEASREYFKKTIPQRLGWLNDVREFVNNLDKKGSSKPIAVDRINDKSIDKEAKRYFGTTFNLNEAGYILTDGSLLDFSGKKEGGRAGQRAYDHRDISSAFESRNYDIDMEAFVNNGAIRFMPESNSLFIANIPTAKQMNIIKYILEKADGEINVELVNDAKKMGSSSSFYKEFNAGSTIKNVKNVINAYYSGNLSKLQTFFQSAFAGSRVDYDIPSLEAIGSGEGAQVHGWGLYYALNRDVAERYRETFLSDKKDEDRVEYKGKRLSEFLTIPNSLTTAILYKEGYVTRNKVKEIIKRNKSYLERDMVADEDIDTYQEELKILEEIDEALYSKSVDNVFDIQTGQVHEVDIPENPYLLDEGLTFNEQPEFVKDGLRKALTDDAFSKYFEDMSAEEFSSTEIDDFSLGMTGGNIYDRISNLLGSDKDASLLLNKYGIKGITYDGRQDGRCFVIFNPDDVKIIQKFYQKSKKQNKIKGSFDALTKSIKITSEADFSSLQHEFAHFWLDNIWNYANSGQASENYLKQFNEIKKWLGTKGNYPTRNQHEKFARAYEKYLYKGTNADAPIGQAFKDYENFIREVYSDIAEIDTRAGEKKYKPIPRVVYNFFDSMVSGKLHGVIVDDEPEKEVEKEVKEVKEFIKEETKVLEENRANYTLKPVQTDTKTGYLTAYEKMTGEQVEAGSIELKDQMEKAENFVANNPEQAERIVNGLEQAPDGIVKNAVYIAYNNLQKKLGNTDKRVNSMLNQALELRRMGQEIASQRLAYADVEGEASATFWIKEVIKNKAEALADANGLTVTELSDKIDNAISDGIANNKKPEDIVKQLGEELGVTEFYQTEVLSGFGVVDTYAHSYIKRYVNERLGLGMSKTEAETIIRKADDMLASLQNSMSKTGNPNVDYFVKLKDMENYANSLAPSSNARVIVSVIGRGNLLASIKSPVTNIVSNGFVGAFRGAVRRINLGVVNSIVSPELIKQNKAYSWEIFKKTGYNVNNITKDKPRNLILGEELTHSKGEGLIRKLGRGYEEIVYKWGLGAGDVLFKDYAFTDYVALKATKLAKGDVNKANEIFKDACLIEPKTKEGAEIREEAIQESLIATYQNDSAISESALTVRKKMDLGIGFGEFIAPFVKTPANVVSMGLKSGFGSVRAIFSEIKRDVKAGKILKPTQENIDLVVQNGLGLLLASMLLNAIDDDDYMPPYALASSKDKQLAKELNIPYNAIRIGNTWVSLDYLGVLASPLMGLLQARRENGIINSIFGYIKSGGIQALSIPAFGEVADIFEKIKNSVRKSGEDTLAVAGGELLEQTYARVIPSIFSDIAKALDSYDRETKGDEIRTKIPWARERAFEKVSVTSGVAEELGSPISDLLFGSRVKEQVTNDVADELQRLNNAGWGVSLTTVTRSGLLSELDEDTKQKVREDFAVEYSKQVKRLIKGAKYKRSSDEDKQEMINKIRRDIISGLKRRYLKKKKQ